jgi:hypothetical protein
MKLKTLLGAVLLFACVSVGFAQVARELVGRYQMDVQGGDILELRADGTASMGGEEFKWSARGNQLRLGTDVVPYTLQGRRLILTTGPLQIAWNRLGAGGGAASGGGTGRPAAGAGQAGGAVAQSGNSGAPQGNGQDAEARQVLTGSAWCSFTYNKVSGTSTTRRVVFRRDGIMTVNGGAETYSSGYGGTVAGQSSSSSALRWKLENMRLFLDDGSGFQDIGLSATRNSNGYVILQAQGREYSMCN